MSRLTFFEQKHYVNPDVRTYSLLPFNFLRLDTESVLLTTDLGEYALVTPEVFDDLVNKRLNLDSTEYRNLRSKHIVSDARSSVHARVLASKYRTKKGFLEGFTKLHIFVVSLRCDHACPYCQVSRVSQDRTRFDMTVDMAHRAVDLMLRSPAPAITCEFQGGEALFNFDLVQEIVRYANEQNASVGKSLSFVICTNLSTLSDAHLDYFRENSIRISTSLDGPAFLHDKNRPLTRSSSHALVTRNIRRAQEALGRNQISALMTTTRESLNHPREIIDEYVRMDLGSIFLRSLSPYGFAVKTSRAIGYTARDFLTFYRQTLDYIIDLNRQGRNFPEAYASLILRKILTPFSTGYVDLQSPAGAGFSAVVYNYDGDVYASDEARMLAEMDDTTYRLGNVLENSYEEIFFGDKMQEIAAASCNEALAGCSDCAFQPFCGADPVYHYATQGDMFGNRATSGFCTKNMGIIRLLFEKLRRDDQELQEILMSWVMDSSVAEMKLPRPEWLSA